jgi:hypothetical protein
VSDEFCECLTFHSKVNSSKSIVWYCLLLLALLTLIRPSISRAQFDPNCYHPIVGKPGEVDTVYGSLNEQELTNSFNLGPAPGESYGRVMMYGLPQNLPFLSAVTTGPTFDLNHLNVALKTKLDLWRSQYRLGHFHNSKLVDILRAGVVDDRPARIYWASETGDYDTSSYTDLVVPVRDTEHVGYMEVVPYCAHLSQDTVEDVVYGIERVVIDRFDLDTDYLVHFKGGSKLYDAGKRATPDSEVFFQKYDRKVAFPRMNFEGDWRGVGRRDLLVGDRYGNLFYYRNDTPFSLSRLSHAIVFDTIWAAWQNPTIRIGPNMSNWDNFPSISIKALPKPHGETSEDFAIVLPTSASSFPLSIFRGSAAFGNKRLTSDSAEFLLYPPERYNGSYKDWYLLPAMLSCGDMTGTGRNVLLTEYTSPDSYSVSVEFYVLGDALDDKADIQYFANHFYAGFGKQTVDTITADGDRLADVIIGMPGYQSLEDVDNHKSNVGTIQVVHGSRLIPVPSKVVETLDDAISEVNVFPNPVKTTVSISFSGEKYGTGKITVRNLLGQIVLEQSITARDGKQSVLLNMQHLPTGPYQVEVFTGTRRIVARMIKVE